MSLPWGSNDLSWGCRGSLFEKTRNRHNLNIVKGVRGQIINMAGAGGGGLTKVHIIT